MGATVYDLLERECIERYGEMPFSRKFVEIVFCPDDFNLCGGNDFFDCGGTPSDCEFCWKGSGIRQTFKARVLFDGTDYLDFVYSAYKNRKAGGDDAGGE